MLAYAFRVLNEKSYKKLEMEEFENISELLSEILIIGISKQIKQGLVNDYIDVTEDISSPKGKINVIESANDLSFIKGKLNCIYDEFSANCYLNQILKSTLSLLVKSDVSPKRKKKLKNLLLYFREVDLIDVKTINWKIRFDRNNQTYKMLINICYLVVAGLIHSEESGSVKVSEFFDDQQMSRLYEKFLLNYFRKEHPQISTNALTIDWQIDEGWDVLLPKMKTDVTLEYGGKILIIDAKFYTQNTLENYGKNIHHSGNLYQIFTYVKNKDLELQGNDVEVSGMLLYAMTTSEIQPDSNYVMGGNKISVKTLDLNQNFEIIKCLLDCIVDEYLFN